MTLSFSEQTARYFHRPHTSIPTARLTGPAAWYGADLVDLRSTWMEEPTDEEIDELDQAAARVLQADVPLETVSRSDIELPGWRARITGWRRELSAGRGFLLVRGLPVVEWGDRKAQAALWAIGVHLGQPGAQDTDGSLIGHVKDEGERGSVRAYRTNLAIRYHCDAADAVGLLCLAAAASGGLSRLASSVTVFNELLQHDPDLAARLFQPFALDARSEDGPVRHVPVQPCCYANDQLRTFFHSDYFRSAARHPDVELDRRSLRLLDAYDAIAEREDVRLEMRLGVGDLQLVSNHTVVHGRTAYEDTHAGQHRHLARLWLTLNEPVSGLANSRSAIT